MLALVHSSAEGDSAEAEAVKAKTVPNKSAAAGGRVLLSWRCVGPRARSIPIRQECGGARRRRSGFGVRCSGLGDADAESIWQRTRRKTRGGCVGRRWRTEDGGVESCGGIFCGGFYVAPR